jgi:hypothetical protein
MDFLTIHHSELQVITALPLIYTIHKLQQHPLSPFQPAVSSPAVLWQRLLTVDILQFPALKMSSQPPVQNSTSTNNSQACGPFHTTLLVYSSQADFQLTESESELLYDLRFTANRFVLATSQLRPTTSIFFNWTLSVIVLMQHLLWREDGSIVYNCCWSSSAQSFSGPSPAGLMTIFYCLRLETPPTWRARSPYLYPPGTGFCFRRLLRLAELRWRCSNPPRHGVLTGYPHVSSRTWTT